jgi:hypothetical protein
MFLSCEIYLHARWMPQILVVSSVCLAGRRSGFEPVEYLKVYRPESATDLFTSWIYVCHRETRIHHTTHVLDKTKLV